MTDKSALRQGHVANRIWLEKNMGQKDSAFIDESIKILKQAQKAIKSNDPDTFQILLMRAYNRVSNLHAAVGANIKSAEKEWERLTNER